MAAGINSGIAPLQFTGSIQVGSRQLGNRAFLRWVVELHAAGREIEAREVAAPGLQAASRPLTRQAPLQFMSKRKKKGKPVVNARPEALSEAPPETGTATVPETQAAMPRTQSGATASPVEKKKKKKPRVQVALNTLRAEGLKEFRCYIEAEIGEPELLRTLAERISRAQDLGAKKAPALGTVEARMRALDLDGAPTTPQAVVPEQGMFAEKPLMAPVKTVMSIREEELVDCCFKGNAVKFKQLLRFGTVDVNLAIENGTLLFTAALRGHVAIVRELLSKPGIDVNLAQKSGGTPLFAAAQIGHVEVVRLLMEAPGIKFNLGIFPEGTTPLIVAAVRKQAEVVRLLLTARNFNINIRQHDGATALFAATEHNCPEIVELLIRRGADVNLPLNDSTSPLCYAVYYCHIEVVKFLLQASDIRVNHKSKGQTALSYACQQGRKEVVELLLNKKANPNIASDMDVAPLHHACLLGDTDIVGMLLDAGVDTEMIAEKKYTPYQIAQVGGHHEVKNLLEARWRGQAAQFERLSPCLRPAEPAPLLTTCRARPPAYDLQSPPLRKQGGRLCESRGAGSAKAGGQALEDQSGHASPSTFPSASLPHAATIPVMQPGEATALPEIGRDSGDKGGREPADVAQTTAAPPDSSRAVPGSQPQLTAIQSPLARAKQEFIQKILRKLRNDWLDPLDGIRLLEAVNTVSDLDGLCRIHNRLSGIERTKMRTGRTLFRRSGLAVGTQARLQAAGPPTFTLGDKQDLDADAVEDEIKQHLEQSYHRFVSQAVNDMEFGRGKPVTGYPGLLHASAGISGVGSCSVFFYVNPERHLVWIVGIGHHLDRQSYRLNYAVEELGGSGSMLRFS